MFLLIQALVSVAMASVPSAKNSNLHQLKVPVRPDFKTLSTDQFKGLGNPMSGSPRHFQFSAGCKTNTGAEYKAGEAGYDSCLREAHLSRGGPESRAGHTQSVDFKIGD